MTALTTDLTVYTLALIPTLSGITDIMSTDGTSTDLIILAGEALDLGMLQDSTTQLPEFMFTITNAISTEMVEGTVTIM